jgi:hypothetical protein
MQWAIECAGGRVLRIRHDKDRGKVQVRIETAEGSTQVTCHEKELVEVMMGVFPPPKATEPKGTKDTGARMTT